MHFQFLKLSLLSFFSLSITAASYRFEEAGVKKVLIDFSLRLLFSLKPKEMAKMRLFAIIMDRLEVKL